MPGQGTANPQEEWYTPGCCVLHCHCCVRTQNISILGWSDLFIFSQGARIEGEDVKELKS